ncbi:hypothetical protein SKAU_G00004330 [Synaphobranchus kaupii]|uniref:Uncharacterized protein n=1 Tax=Synaphobranchus kaupii TaxID=118154 RepID=A0A9Q1G8U8_SYNKA|nr:hypothetical protein SKAU_G00004330 [Synaphobranchus kaupii]
MVPLLGLVKIGGADAQRGACSELRAGGSLTGRTAWPTSISVPGEINEEMASRLWHRQPRQPQQPQQPRGKGSPPVGLVKIWTYCERQNPVRPPAFRRCATVTPYGCSQPVSTVRQASDLNSLLRSGVCNAGVLRSSGNEAPSL